MADRVDFFFKQQVQEDELNLPFSLLENADRNLATDLGLSGIVEGMQVTPHQPVADLTVDLTAPAIAYDLEGERIFFATPQTVDVSKDENGAPTAVSADGKEKTLTLFVAFSRALSDPRIDGNSVQVFFRQSESLKLLVDQGVEAPAGASTPPAPRPDAVLLCDVVRRFGQTQILAGDLSVARRQTFQLAPAKDIGVVPDFSTLAPAADTVQATLEAVDAELTAHFAGTAGRHKAADVDAATITGAPNNHAAGPVQAGLQGIEDDLNAHENAAAGAHLASAIAFTPGGTLKSTNVQEAIAEEVAGLAAAGGAALVGNAALAGVPKSQPAGTVAAQLQGIEGDVNALIADLAAQVAGKGTALVGYSGYAGVPDAIGATTLKAALDLLVALVNARAKLMGATFTGGVTFDAGAQAPSGQTLQGGLLRADAGTGAGVGVKFGAAGVNDGLEWDTPSGTLTAVKGGKPLGVLRAGSIDIPTGPGFVLAQHLDPGAGTPHIRFYTTLGEFLLTVNAAWNGVAWVADAPAFYAAMFQFSGGALTCSFKAVPSAAWTGWDVQSNLDLTAGEWTSGGPETGMLVAGASSPPLPGFLGELNVAINFKKTFPATPSSVTVKPISSTNVGVGYPIISNIQPYGAEALVVGTGPGYFVWRGSYTAKS
jgi:hypothetical protein